MNNIDRGTQLRDDILYYLHNIYDDVTHPALARDFNDDLGQVANTLISALALDGLQQQFEPRAHQNHWDETRIMMISYADSIFDETHPPLQVLHHFLNTHLADMITDVHLLPFYPYSSDDGFSVIDYSTVNPAHGDWRDINQLSREYNLMFDLVINHCSTRSQWFTNFIAGTGKGHDFFMTASPEDDTSMVTRPRVSPLLKPTETSHGLQHVWCTFSHDQVDFDFTNPNVLIEFARIINLYLENGASLFRLDAVAFLWKTLGTSCINLVKTHEIIKLYRLLIEHKSPKAIIITETNIPNQENLSYFGNANEAHAIYNFSLPPLLINTLVSQDSSALTQWLMSMPPAQNGTAYFNFIASHDGIGLRPAEGLLSPETINELVTTMQDFNGKISWRTAADGSQSPYEINIALIDACRGTHEGEDEWQIARFMCAHTIMLGLEGIPGIYIHSLLGTMNDIERVINTGQNRSINRHRWEYNKLDTVLNNENSLHYIILDKMKTLINIRQQQSAFHPNATQFTLQLGEHCFGYWRQSMDRAQSVFCITNISKQAQFIRISDVNLISTQTWSDLLSNLVLAQDQQTLTLAPYQTLWLTNR